MKVKLGDIFEIGSGGTPSKSCPGYYGGDIPWVKTGDLKEMYLYDVEDTITEEGLNNSSAKLYEPNTVLIAMYGATIGATSILRLSACTNQACAAFKPNGNVMPEFLYYFLRSRREKFIKDGVGGAQPNISAGYLKKVEMELPEFDEQEEIVNILTRVSGIIDKRKQELQQLDELIKARFVEMFGEQFNGPSIKVGDIAKVFIGLTYKPENVSEGGTIVLRSGNIQNQSLQTKKDIVRVSGITISEKKFVQDKDILMCSRNGSARLVGKSCLIRNPKEEMAFGAFMSVIRTEYPYFLQGFFSSDFFKNQLTNVGTTSVNQITSKMLNNYCTILPTNEQEKEFSEFCVQVDKSKLLLLMISNYLCILTRNTQVIFNPLFVTLHHRK